VLFFAEPASTVTSELPLLEPNMPGAQQYRYNAACCAALAAGGQGKDADKLDDKERARLREQACDWLRAIALPRGRAWG
jgi:hypothetical protein